MAFSTFLSIYLFKLLLVKADLCLENYGGCDKVNGLYWGTSSNTHFCSCKVGYKQDDSSGDHKCIDVEECLEEKPCGEKAYCENTEGSYVCQCKCGYIMDYTGQNCLEARRITGLCYHPIFCTHLTWPRAPPVIFHTRYAEEGYVTDMSSMAAKERITLDRNTCSCEPGFRQDECGFCRDVNECVEDENVCVGPVVSCINTEGSYYCQCKDGFILGTCQKKCYAPGMEIPLNCEGPEHSMSSNDPIPVKNWRKCDVEGQGTKAFNPHLEEASDLDQDGVIDVSLAWNCNQDGHSVLENMFESQARWAEWTCWTACKPTCWGGLQTRSRYCMHGEPGLDGCEGRGSESRECYTGPKCPYRIRRDAKTLTTRQIIDLLQAMEKYKADQSAKGFFSAASAHGWPNQCGRKGCCPHGARVNFLAWHRTLALHFEEGLSRYLNDKTLGLPYWNWLAKDPSPPELVWRKFLCGWKNPFANMTVRLDRNGAMRTIQRDVEADIDSLKKIQDAWRDVTRTLTQSHRTQEFAASLENLHNEPHTTTCWRGLPKKCELSLRVIEYAAFDPIFMLHHNQVDRLWAVAQKKMEMSGNTAWTAQTAVLKDQNELGKRQQPFDNKTLIAFPIVQAVNTLRDSYYYNELTGVAYDYLDNDGFPEDEPELRPTGVMLFIAHYLKNIFGEEPIYVNYYINFGDDPCSQLTEDYRIGSDAILPTNRPFKNSLPILIAVEKIGFGDPDEDFKVKACYTNQHQCTTKCSEATNPELETMPTPILVHHLGTKSIEIYKLNWSAKSIMPGWTIYLKSSSQWIYFYGTRQEHIVQVKTFREWYDCDGSSGTAFRCSHDNSACMLPVGTHYLIDDEGVFCRDGLRIIVASKI